MMILLATGIVGALVGWLYDIIIWINDNFISFLPWEFKIFILLIVFILTYWLIRSFSD